MKLWFKAVATAAAITVASSVSLTASAQDKHAAVKEKVESTLGLNVTAIADAPVDGLLQVLTDKGLFYTSQDGKYFMQARIFNLDEDMRNETEAALSKVRLDGISQFNSDVIEFKAKKEKYVVNVFTDITCGYCQRLHAQIAEYNDLGITVRYLAFPRGGLNSASYNNMVSVWCAKDQQEAMTEAKSSGNVDPASCANTVAEQYNFGVRIGVTGTPNIILPDGSLIGGYQPAPQLLQSLQQI